MTPSRVSKTGSHVTCLETRYGYRETTSRRRETGSYLEFVDAHTKFRRPIAKASMFFRMPLRAHYVSRLLMTAPRYRYHRPPALSNGPMETSRPRPY